MHAVSHDGKTEGVLEHRCTRQGGGGEETHSLLMLIFICKSGQ